MNATLYKEEIESIISRARAHCPAITDEKLDGNGAIYYMNGKNGTDFDWHVNEHLSAFSVFHKNEIGFVKVYIEWHGVVDVYIYEDGGMKPTHTYRETLERVRAEHFAILMDHIADDKELWNKPIDALDWNVDDAIFERGM